MTSTTSTRARSSMIAHAVCAEGSKLCSLPAIWMVLGGTLALTIVLSIAFGVNATMEPGSGVNILDYGVTPLTWTQVGFFGSSTLRWG